MEYGETRGSYSRLSVRRRVTERVWSEPSCLPRRGRDAEDRSRLRHRLGLVHLPPTKCRLHCWWRDC